MLEDSIKNSYDHLSELIVILETESKTFDSKLSTNYSTQKKKKTIMMTNADVKCMHAWAYSTRMYMIFIFNNKKTE